MNRVLMGFLLRRWWWVWLVSLLMAAMAGWFGGWPFLGLAMMLPLLTLFHLELSEGLLRSLNFLPIRRAETGRSLWCLLVLLPMIVLVAGIAGGWLIDSYYVSIKTKSYGWTRALVAAFHAGSLTALAFLAMTARSSSRLAGYITASLFGFLSLMLFLAIDFLRGELEVAFNAYLDSAMGAGVGLLFVPLAAWAWLRAPYFHVPNYHAFGHQGARSPRGSRGLAGRGQHGERSLFVQEATRMVVFTLAMWTGVLLVNWIMGNREHEPLPSYGFMLFMPVMFFMVTPFPLRELRMQPLSTRKLALLILTAPLVLALMVSVFMAWVLAGTTHWPQVLASVFCIVSGPMIFFRVTGLTLSVMLILILTSFLSFMLLVSGSFLKIEASQMVVLGVILGLALALFSWWWLERLLKRGTLLYARSRQAYARTVAVMAKRG